MKGLLGGKKLVIIIIAAVALLVGMMAGLFIVPMSLIAGSPLAVPGGGAKPTAEASPSPGAARNSPGKEGGSQPGIMYSMKERIVNLADTGSIHYLKAEVVLEFEVPDAKGLKADAYKKRQEEFAKEIASWRPRMDDTLTTILGSKTSVFLSSAEGKEKLREELKNKLAEAVGEYRLTNLYFTQFVIQ